MSTNKRSLASVNPLVETRDVVAIKNRTGNLYESITVMSRRASQIAVTMKEELHRKLDEFTVHGDNLEEIHENKEQIEISRIYERMANPALQSINEFAEDKRIEWNYHVVPVVDLKTANDTCQMILDPSLDKSRLLPLSEFFTMIGNAGISRYTFMLPDKYFFNTSVVDNMPTNIFDGSFFDFDECVKDDLTMEKGLASNDMAMKIYNSHVQHLVQSTDDNEIRKLNDLKAIFGNATAVDLLFSQNISGKSANTSYRYVMKNYPGIMEEARRIFYSRLAYWTEFTNALLS